MDAQDPRWIVLAENGLYVTVGRHREPDQADIDRIETSLREQGLSGWLAVMSQSEHAMGTPEVMEVRGLAAPSDTFEAARDRLLACIGTGARQG